MSAPGPGEPLGLAGHPKPAVLLSADTGKLRCNGQRKEAGRAMLNDATAGAGRNPAEETTERTILLWSTESGLTPELSRTA